MLTPENTQLVIIDIQGKLARMVHQSESVVKNVRILIQAAKILEIPIVWVEQNRAGLGETIPEISELLNESQPLHKMTFSAMGASQFRDVLMGNNRRDVIISGIETHVCVYQTTAEILAAGYGVTVVADAVSSRTQENKVAGIQKMKDLGAQLSTTEMLVFELQKTCEGVRFKELLQLVK